MQKEVLIKKLDGTMEPFDSSKLQESLTRAGASKESTDYIVAHINNELTEGMTTSHIYKHAFEILKKKERTPAARYSLKRAVMELGPTGFPFERFLGEILKNKGYEVTLGTTIEGACAPHEIDVLARNDKILILVEAKFHNQLSVKSDLKVALYVRARYDDLEKNNFQGHLEEGMKHECWIVTNTDLTNNAVTYGKCVNMKMIGWSKTRGYSLQDMIEESGLHPITCLTTLSQDEKNQILNQGKVLCKDARDNRGLFEGIGLKGKKLDDVLTEIKNVCIPRPLKK